MLRALKNDILALEYPINQFMSQCIRNGEIPYWFNTWSLGFPLQSNLSWGIFSSPRIFFSGAFEYNIYVLQLEFLFFILLSGWSMFHFLHRQLRTAEKTAQLLAVCYMLSGFMVGSTQWLLYITAAAFTPVVLSSLFSLLRKPSAVHAFQAAVCYTLFFTSVYAAFSIILTYLLLAGILGWCWLQRKNRAQLLALVRYGMLAIFFILLFCGPCLWFTVELLGHIDRGSGLATESSFFNSNYLHPGALSSLLFPLSSAKMEYLNTEGTMLDSYVGLFPLLLLPVGVAFTIRQKNRRGFVLLAVAILMLLLAFGNYTPLRQALNLLPGFAYFRNPAIFRFYFILFLLLFLAEMLKQHSTEELLASPIVKKTIYLLLLICLLVILGTAGAFPGLFIHPATLIRSAGYPQLVLLNALLQMLALLCLWWLLNRRKWKSARLVLAGELALNTLLCTPFFSVSSYSPAAVQAFLRAQEGFPVQTERPAAVPTDWTDTHGNSWHNVNVYAKKISSQPAYSGPLILKEMDNGNPSNRSLPLVSVWADTAGSRVEIIRQRPASVEARLVLAQPDTVQLLQHNYPGWKVYLDGRETPVLKQSGTGIAVQVPAGEHRVSFRYERKAVAFSALLVHLAVLVFLWLQLRKGIRRIRSFSPSSRY